MFALHDNDRLYLNNWEYNSARILTELAGIVAGYGGTTITRPYHHTAIISNRTLEGAVRKARERVDSIQRRDSWPDAVKNELLANAQAELEGLLVIDNTPVTARFLSSISFILDNVYYVVEFDDNPFFDFHYMKIRLDENGEITGRHYMNTLDGRDKWMSDVVFGFHCSTAECLRMAVLLLDQLKRADFSQNYIKKTRRRVPNTYDNGYHYETLTDPESKRKVNPLKQMVY